MMLAADFLKPTKRQRSIKKMIATMTLNPCIDRTVFVRALQVGGHNVSHGVQIDPAGKGINVSIALKQWGLDTLCLGFHFTQGGRALTDRLHQAGVPFLFEEVPGPMRVNLKITDEISGQMTEINEPGSPVSGEAVEALMQKLREQLPRIDMLVLSGSAPASVPAGIYADMIRLARDQRIKTVLDTSGPLLRPGLAARPWLIKPNQLELETLLGQKITSVKQAAHMARELTRGGIEIVCVSLGSRGAVLAAGEEAWFSPCADIPVRGRQGAGDAMVAGLCMAAMEQLSPADMLRCAAAAAHASLLLPGTQMCTREGLLQMLPGIQVRAAL